MDAVAFDSRRQFARSLHITVLVTVASLVILPVLGGCAAANRDAVAAEPMPGDPALRPTENLRLLAQQEMTESPARLLNAPPPPGVDPKALARADSSIETAHFSFEQALVKLAGEYVPPPEVHRNSQLDRVAETAALRHYAKGRQAALDDRHLVAITELNRALELDPHSAAVVLALARSHLAVGNQSRALQHYEQLLQLSPADSEAQLAVALGSMNRRDYARAAGIIASRRRVERSFDHDQGADLLADFTLAAALRNLGYDRAGIEAATELAEPQFHVIEHTRYAAQLTAAYRGQSELWRWVGDAHCRLGEYDRALEAYGISAGFASPDPSALHPRVIYANLQLGRRYTAQREMLAALQSDPESISDRDIRLCAYLYQHGQPVQHLAAAVAQMYRAQPDHSDLARAAASLLPPDDSAALLREFVDRRPRDLHAVGQLLNWVAANDTIDALRAAVRVTVQLIEDHPDLAGEYCGKLFFAAPRPSRLVPAVRSVAARSQPNAAAANLEVRIIALLGGLGEAWTLMKEARSRWSEDEALVSLELDLAILMDEPALIAQAIDNASNSDDVATLLSLSRAHRATGDAGAAMDAADNAVQRAERDSLPVDARRRALLQLARACAAFASEQANLHEMRKWGEEAVSVATRALELDPAADEVHEFFLSIYGPNGALANTTDMRHAARQLLQANPDSRLYARLAAEESINHGRLDEALERLLHLYDSDPSDTRALRLAVAVWVRQGRNDAALQWINERMEQRSGDPALLEAWTELMLQSGSAEAAIERLEALLDSPGESDNHAARHLLETLYRNSGRAERALALAEQRLLARPRAVRREAELAAVYGGAGMKDEAVSRIRWVAGRADEATYDHLATAIAVLGRLDDADDDLHRLTVHLVQQTVERYPDSPLQMYGTAVRSLARLGRIDDQFDAIVLLAVRTSQNAAGPTPQHAMTWRELAQALIDDGEPLAAARALHLRTLADVPTAPDALNMLATFAVVADAAVHGGDAEMTLTMVNELAARGRLPVLAGMAEAESISAVLFHVSQVFALLGNDAGSEALLREVVAYDPTNAIAMNNAGYMRIEAGHDDDETIALIERAIALAPDDASILDTAGWLRYRQGVFGGDDGALTLIERSLEASGEPSGEVLDHLGDVQWRLGMHDAAVNSWQQAATLLGDPQQRQQIQQNYYLLQTRGWGLLVADPEELYNRDIGERFQNVQRKLQAVEQGEEPPVTATFEELRQ